MRTVDHHQEAVWTVWETRETSRRQRRKPIPDEEGQIKRWIEHFEELLNRPAPHDPPDIPPANDVLPINCNPLTEKEIYQASLVFAGTGPAQIRLQHCASS